MLSEGTKRTYSGDFKYFLTFLGLPPFLEKSKEQIDALAKVTKEKASAFRDYMLNKHQLSASTVCRRLTVVNTVYEALREEGIIAKNPFARVRRPRVGNVGKTPAFSKEQAERILAQPNRSTALGRRDRVLLLLMFFCGLRRNEVAKVSRDDFYESQGHMLLRVHSKGRSDKTDSVLIPPQIWPEIRAYIDRKIGLLFTAQSSRNTRYNREDKPLSATRIYLLFKKYCRMAGIDADAFSPHSTRATFITLCLSGGADVRSVMYAARHADPSTTIRYDRARLELVNPASQHLNLDVSGGDDVLASSDQ